MAAEEAEDGLRFLYKFVTGRASSSFGLNVARLAGLDVRINYYRNGWLMKQQNRLNDIEASKPQRGFESDWLIDI